MTQDLHGAVVLVTGASSGIGRATALAMAREGAYGGLFARRAHRLKAVAEEIESSGGLAVAFPGDVMVAQDVERAVTGCVEKFGRLDALVNNAGIGLFASTDRQRRKTLTVS